METFVTRDNAVVCVSSEFLRLRMDNGVVPRLLGWRMRDGLTTPKPSRNTDGHLTILQHMHIRKAPFLKLLQFLRVGWLPHHHLQEAYEASIPLGGFPPLDAYMRGHAHQGAAHHPMTPQEDVWDLYAWTVCHMNTIDVNKHHAAGWSVTQPVAPAEGADCVHVYLRLEKPLRGYTHDSTTGSRRPALAPGGQ